ncbi:hypothetical protein [Pseudonocardia aurantiaca]|uniref:Uncharacterized protein n=1 Tax=Pseudonocardia aurantiaca TaxID=75290 RepID=A0ABW4FP72_9PSEU
MTDKLPGAEVSRRLAAEGVGAGGRHVGVDVPVHAGNAALRLPILPDEFWDEREVHKKIREAAHVRLVSADLVLHVVFARIAAMRSHQLMFDSGRGESSLNYCVAGVGPSGVGKTTGTEAAADVVNLPRYLRRKLDKAGRPLDEAEPDPFADGLPIGSGEGIAETYMGLKDETVGETKKGEPITRRVRTMVRYNAWCRRQSLSISGSMRRRTSRRLRLVTTGPQQHSFGASASPVRHTTAARTWSFPH